jgi:hypothetical protein
VSKTLFVLLGLCLAAGMSAGQMSLERSVVSNGGDAQSGVGYRMDATCGQAIAGIATGPVFNAELGFWYAMGSSSSVPGETGPVPEQFELAGGLGTSLGSRGMISFAVPHNSHVALRLHDVTGRAVQLVTAREYTPGWYETRLDARGLPSGIYFCRLTSGATAITCRVMLMR